MGLGLAFQLGIGKIEVELVDPQIKNPSLLYADTLN